VCLLTSGRSVRRRLRPAARIACSRPGQATCGEEGGKSQADTLSPSQRHCVYVSASARVSVCVRAYRKKQPPQSSTHTTTVIDMHMQGICISRIASIHFIWKSLNNVYALNEVLIPHNAFSNIRTICNMYSLHLRHACESFGRHRSDTLAGKI
jgi:hypothetical protein